VKSQGGKNSQVHTEPSGKLIVYLTQSLILFPILLLGYFASKWFRKSLVRFHLNVLLFLYSNKQTNKQTKTKTMAMGNWILSNQNLIITYHPIFVTKSSWTRLLSWFPGILKLYSNSDWLVDLTLQPWLANRSYTPILIGQLISHSNSDWIVDLTLQFWLDGRSHTPILVR